MGSALSVLQQNRWCEEALGIELCPWQFFGFLDVTAQRWRVDFPSCRHFVSTADGPVRNEFAILATTGLFSGSRAGLERMQYGALLLQFQTTTSSKDGWAQLARSRQCSVECLARDTSTGAIQVSSVLVACPSQELLEHSAATSDLASSDLQQQLPTLRQCARGDLGSLLLLPAGELVRDPESKREGELCDWSLAPKLDSEALSGSSSETALSQGLSHLIAPLAGPLTCTLLLVVLTSKSIFLARMLQRRQK